MCMSQWPRAQAEGGVGYTVVIADDDRRLRALLIWTLEMGQYRVLAAVDGLDALAQAREHQPDLFVLDVGMPGMNGIDVCRQLREDQVIAPILILTGFGSEEDKVAGLEAGADDYQTNPFGTNELLARANALLPRTTVYAGESAGDAFVTGSLRVGFSQTLG